MIREPLLEPNRSYTFFDYFRLNQAVDEIAAFFGYSYERTRLSLPQAAEEIVDLDHLKRRLELSLKYVDMTNETARREFLIAPVLSTVIMQTDARIRVERPLYVSNELQGSLDYLLELHNLVLVIEAKNADMQRGFNQLAAELIALDRYLDPGAQPHIFGAVSVGEVWQFARLERTAKHLAQDIALFRVPEDVESLLRVIIALLRGMPGQ